MANLTRYTEEEKERALTVLAIHQGNRERAVRQLHAEGLTISRPTLISWVQKEPARYQSILDHRVKHVEREIVDQTRDQLHATLQAKNLSLAATIQQLEEGKAKDPSSVDRNLTVSAGILSTKLLELTDRKPTTRIEIEDVRQAESVLAQSGLIAEAEVVEDESPSLS